MKNLYAGIDLHSTNSFIGITDGNDRRIYDKRLPNMPDVILTELEPYKNNIVGVVVDPRSPGIGWWICSWIMISSCTRQIQREYRNIKV